VDNFTQDQLVAARDLVLDLMATYRIPRDNVMGHKEVIANITHGSPKACPVFSMDGFRDMVAERELAGVDGEHSEPWGSEMSDRRRKRGRRTNSYGCLWGYSLGNREQISHFNK
jgi:hypothetical protein